MWRTGAERAAPALELPFEGRRIPVAEARPAATTQVEEGIFYIDIGRIDDAAFEAALPRLDYAIGIIFDFRGYPGSLSPTFLGHLSAEPFDSPGFFTSPCRRK